MNHIYTFINADKCTLASMFSTSLPTKVLILECYANKMESIIADISDIHYSLFQDLLEAARYSGKCLSPKSYMNYVLLV